MKIMPPPEGRETTFFERERIGSYLRIKKRQTWIAKTLNRDYSVIKKEIKRSSEEGMPYTASNARKYADRRKHKTDRRELEKEENIKLKKSVEEKLRVDTAPKR